MTMPEPATQTAFVADVPNGYKSTEIGVLPEGWKEVRLKDVAENVFGGGTPSTARADFWDGDVPWTTTAIFREQDIYLQGFQRGITQEGLQNSSTQIAAESSVLIGTRVGVGKAVVTPLEVAVNQDITVFVPKYDLLPEFLALLMKSPSLQRWFTDNKRGTTIKGVPRKDVLDLEIPLPPLPEQQSIASVLRTVQQAKEATEQVINSARELKRSLMNHLFTYGLIAVEEADQVPLKETEIGSVPEHWATMRIGDIAKVGNGSTPKRTKPEYWEGGLFPWLTSGKVHEGVIRKADEFITLEALESCHLPLVPAGSVVVAITGQGKTLGNSALLALDATVNQHLAYIKLNDGRLIPEFLQSFLQTRYQDLRSVGYSGGSTKGALTCGFLKTYTVPLPPPE